MIRIFTALAAAIVAFGLSGTAWAQGAPKAPAGKPAIGAGEIVSFAGGKMTVKLRDGSTVNLNVPDNAGVTGLKAVPFSQLKKGDFIATAAIKQADGTLVAREVRIFAPEARGRVPEMHGPYPGGANSTMTNAIVDTIVSTDAKKRTFKVTGKGGEHTVVIPENVPLMQSVAGNHDMLKPGAHITFFANETDKGLNAVRFGVGLDGLKPPV